MSGGSYNYAADDSHDLEDVMSKRSDWESLRDAFESLEVDDVAAEIDAMLKYVEVANRRVIARLARLRDVAHGMEWFHSCDWSKAQLEEEIKKYRGEK